MAKRASVVLQDNGHRKLTPSFQGRSLSCFLAACCPWLEFPPYITGAVVFFEHTSKKCSQKLLVWLLINIKNSFSLCNLQGNYIILHILLNYMLYKIIILLNYILYYLSKTGRKFYSLTPHRLDGLRRLRLDGGNKEKFHFSVIHRWISWISEQPGLQKETVLVRGKACFLSSGSVQGLEGG